MLAQQLNVAFVSGDEVVNSDHLMARRAAVSRRDVTRENQRLQ